MICSFFDRIFKMIVDIESGIIFSLLPVNVITISAAMYTMEHVRELNCSFFSILKIYMLFEFQSNFDPITLSMNIIGIVCTLIWPTCFSYFANLATDRVLKNGDIAYALNWYDHPIELQKYVILMIARSHERNVFTGYGLILCSLEAYGKVCSDILNALNHEQM